VLVKDFVCEGKTIDKVFVVCLQTKEHLFQSKASAEFVKKNIDKVCVVRLQTKEHAFQSKASAEFAKLRTVQAELEQEAGQACFLGCSVTQTGLPCLISSGLLP